MKKVLIISQSFDLQTQLELALADVKVSDVDFVERFELYTSGSFGQERSYWIASAFDLLIIDVPSSFPVTRYFIAKLKSEVPSAQPVLILTSEVDKDLMALNFDFVKFRLLKKPYEPEALIKIFKDQFRQFKSGAQVHARFTTNIAVVLTSPLYPGEVRGTMEDVSAGGARVIISKSTVSYQAGDLVTCNISLPSRQYSLDGKVVWRTAGQSANDYSIGIQFLTRELSLDQLFKGNTNA